MVEDWGIGHPDFTTAAGRTEVLSNQTPFTVGFIIDLPPGFISIPALYAVPTSKKFILGYIKTGSAIDCITSSTLLKNGVSFCPLYARGMVVDQLPDTSGFVFEAGDVLGLEGTNPLDVPLSISVVLSGFLYDAV